MAHAVVSRQLGRERSFRAATVRGLVQALVKFERITTTLPRAKETQRVAERLVTFGKDGTLSARRRALGILNDPALVARLFSQVAPRFSSRQGGYTRITRREYRAGDGALLAVLEWTQLAAPPPQAKKAKEAKARKEEKPAAGGAVPMEKPQVKEPEEREKEPKKPSTLLRERPAKKEPTGFLQGVRKFFKGRTKK